ncbi:MAG: hypothetical protein QOD07_3206, partial [Frankiaceae bacterium]|nr:hypothetical protein [Frankiaceae bacterium]
MRLGSRDTVDGAMGMMGSVKLPVMPPIKPMLAKSINWDQLHTLAEQGKLGGNGYGQLEPKWDGFRCIV